MKIFVMIGDEDLGPWKLIKVFFFCLFVKIKLNAKTTVGSDSDVHELGMIAFIEQICITYLHR